MDPPSADHPPVARWSTVGVTALPTGWLAYAINGDHPPCPALLIQELVGYDDFPGKDPDTPVDCPAPKPAAVRVAFARAWPDNPQAGLTALDDTETVCCVPPGEDSTPEARRRIRQCRQEHPTTYP